MQVNDRYQNVDLVAAFFSEEEKKVEEMNVFIKNNGLENANFIIDFLSMVEFNVKCDEKGIFKIKLPDGNEGSIQLMNFTNQQQNQFAIGMLKAFEDFDKNLNPPGLITQQFTALAQKCAKKGVKLLIGEDPSLSKISGICIESGHLIDQHYIFINISEDLVKKAMKNPIYIIQQEGNNIPEIKAIPLGNLVAGTMVVNFDDPALIAKCAAYLLFHELFHVNSSYFEFADKGTLTHFESFKESHEFPENVKEEDINLLIAKNFRYDDFRNVTGVKAKTETRVPGEYELLKALCPNKNIMRLYEGKFLNFSDTNVLNAAVKVAQIDFISSNKKEDIIDGFFQNFENILLKEKIEVFFKGKEENITVNNLSNLNKLNKNLEKHKVLLQNQLIQKSKKLKPIMVKAFLELKNSLINFDKNEEAFLNHNDLLQQLKEDSFILKKFMKYIDDFIDLIIFLKDFKPPIEDTIKIDSNVWKTQVDQYMQPITKELEKKQLQNDINNGTYIPID